MRVLANHPVKPATAQVSDIMGAAMFKNGKKLKPFLITLESKLDLV